MVAWMFAGFGHPLTDFVVFLTAFGLEQIVVEDQVGPIHLQYHIGLNK